MMLKIKCPSCGTDSQMSLLQTTYSMPFKCWKCKELFTLTVEEDEVRSCVKMSPEDYAKHRAEEDLKKFKRQF
jgi:DNA-directed RNA polymerase subunit RPC12/RpoP